MTKVLQLRGLIRKVMRRLKAVGGRSLFGSTPPTNILEKYVSSAPHPQNAIDIFKGEWVAKLPARLACTSDGSIPLFEDSRIDWFVERLGGIEGRTVLELGPLEAGHTYMLERYGAGSILSIEANPHAFLKCLIVKELLELKRVRFLCGDFVAYLRNTQDRFDVCLASGVLYHMDNPVELIALLAEATDRLCLWTHYYDGELLSQRPAIARQFSRDAETAEYAGFRHSLHRRIYAEEALNWASFHGGRTRSVCWLTREDLLRCLQYFGLKKIEMGVDEPHHQAAPGLALLASR